MKDFFYVNIYSKFYQRDKFGDVSDGFRMIQNEGCFSNKKMAYAKADRLKDNLNILGDGGTFEVIVQKSYGKNFLLNDNVNVNIFSAEKGL